MPKKKKLKISGLLPGNLNIADWSSYLIEEWHLSPDECDETWPDLAQLLGLKVDRIKRWFNYRDYEDGEVRAPNYLEQIGIAALLEERWADPQFKALLKADLIQKHGTKHQRFMAKHSAKFSPHITFEGSYYTGQINGTILNDRDSLGAYCKVHRIELEMTWNQLRRGGGCIECTNEKKVAASRKLALVKLEAEYAKELGWAKEYEHEEWRIERTRRRYEEKKEVIRTAQVGFLAAELAQVDREYRSR